MIPQKVNAAVADIAAQGLPFIHIQGSHGGTHAPAPVFFYFFTDPVIGPLKTYPRRPGHILKTAGLQGFHRQQGSQFPFFLSPHPVRHGKQKPSVLPCPAAGSFGHIRIRTAAAAQIVIVFIVASHIACMGLYGCSDLHMIFPSVFPRKQLSSISRPFSPSHLVRSAGEPWTWGTAA